MRKYPHSTPYETKVSNVAKSNINCLGIYFSHGSEGKVVNIFWIIIYYKKDEIEIGKTEDD